MRVEGLPSRVQTSGDTLQSHRHGVGMSVQHRVVAGKYLFLRNEFLWEVFHMTWQQALLVITSKNMEVK